MNDKLLWSNVLIQSPGLKMKTKKKLFRKIFKGKSFNSEIMLNAGSLIKNVNNCRKY